MNFTNWWEIEDRNKITREKLHSVVFSLGAAHHDERQRCLAICAKYASVEGIAQKIAEEIKRGE